MTTDGMTSGEGLSLSDGIGRPEERSYGNSGRSNSGSIVAGADA
jgi:hypothetical protein